MGEDRFEMSQKERDRLKVLHEAGKGQITQKQAAEQLRVTERQVRRLMQQIRNRGDVAVVHGCEVELRIVALTAKPSGARSRNYGVQTVMISDPHSRPSMSADSWA